MRIYIDFDDVLCETARHLSALAHDLFNRNVPYEAISGFDLQQAFALSDAQIRELMEQAHRPDFLTDIAPAPGGVEAVRTLEARGHDLAIVTGRPAAGSANTASRTSASSISTSTAAPLPTLCPARPRR